MRAKTLFAQIMVGIISLVGANSFAEQASRPTGDRPLALDICFVVDHIGSTRDSERICNTTNPIQFRRLRNQGITCARAAEWFMMNQNGKAAVDQMATLTGIEAFPDVTIHYETFEGTYSPTDIHVAFQSPNGNVEFNLGNDCSLTALNREIPRHIASYQQRLNGASTGDQRTD